MSSVECPTTVDVRRKRMSGVGHPHCYLVADRIEEYLARKESVFRPEIHHFLSHTVTLYLTLSHIHCGILPCA